MKRSKLIIFIIAIFMFLPTFKVNALTIKETKNISLDEKLTSYEILDNKSILGFTGPEIIKYSANGTRQWEYNLNAGDHMSTCQLVSETNDELTIMCVMLYMHINTDQGINETSIYTKKIVLDQNGKKISEEKSDSGEMIKNITDDYYLVKKIDENYKVINTIYNSKKEKIIEIDEFDNIKEVFLTDDNGFLIFGSKSLEDKIRIIKADVNGTIKSEKEYDTTEIGDVDTIIKNDNNEYVAITSGLEECIVTKFNKDAEIISTKKNKIKIYDTNGSPYSTTSSSDIALDKNGNIIVAQIVNLELIETKESKILIYINIYDENGNEIDKYEADETKNFNVDEINTLKLHSGKLHIKSPRNIKIYDIILNESSTSNSENSTQSNQEQSVTSGDVNSNNQETTKNEENPSTGDKLIKYLMLILVSMLLLSSAGYNIYKKNKEINNI